LNPASPTGKQKIWEVAVEEYRCLTEQFKHGNANGNLKPIKLDFHSDGEIS